MPCIRCSMLYSTCYVKQNIRSKVRNNKKQEQHRERLSTLTNHLPWFQPIICLGFNQSFALVSTNHPPWFQPIICLGFNQSSALFSDNHLPWFQALANHFLLTFLCQNPFLSLVVLSHQTRIPRYGASPTFSSLPGQHGYVHVSTVPIAFNPGRQHE